MKFIRIIAILFVLAVVGCNAPPIDTQMGITAPATELEPATVNSRIVVTRIGVIADKLAYSGRRGLYIITDTKTGKEYVGVSGIGISEFGSHWVGKTRAEDER